VKVKALAIPASAASYPKALGWACRIHAAVAPLSAEQGPISPALPLRSDRNGAKWA